MDLMARALRWLLRGVRKGEPATIVGSGVLMMLLWLRRNPRRRLHLATYDLAPGEQITVRLAPKEPREADEEE
ncbi:MAG: hypothetical protein JSV07_05785 [Acidimicrobiia bacterium]|nr:MAG: hypothetical protein JSV07_05785 [Acidimicrobiia bacterium]